MPALEDHDALTDAGPANGRAKAVRWIVPLAVALVLAGVLWNAYDTRSQLSGIREELARRLRDSDADARDARSGARLAQDSVREAQAKLSLLESKLAESQNQQVALEALYQELSRSRDEWVLAEIEQILAIAAQQLQLAGNVQAALVAFQTADSRLARSDRPQFLPLRKVLARDIERLKAAPALDIPGLALKLDQLVSQVDALPLALDERLSGTPKAADPARGDEGFWRRVGGEIWNEVRQLVRVRNLERPESVLLSPSQTYFLKENLKLRLLNARLALVGRNEAVFREDLKSAEAWIQRYFDVRSRQTAAVIASLKQLGTSSSNLDLPSIAESLTAVRNYKISREQAAR